MNWHFLQWPSLSPVNEWFPLFHISMPVDYRIKWPVEKMDENDSIIFPSAHLNILCLSLSNIFQIQTNRGVYTNFSTFGQTLSFCLISRYYLKINDPITEEKRPFCLFLCLSPTDQFPILGCFNSIFENLAALYSFQKLN